MTIKLSELIEQTNEDKIFTFPLILNGQAYAQTDKKNARLTISIPPQVIGKNLMDKDKWWFRIIAIEKGEYEKIYRKLESKNQTTDSEKES